MDDKDSMENLIFRLRKRAEIRRQIGSRKSVQEGMPDRLADLLEEAALSLELACQEGHHDWQRNGQTMAAVRWTCPRCGDTKLQG